MVHLQNTLGNRDSLKGVNSSPVGFVPDVLVLAVEFQAFGMTEKEGGWLWQIPVHHLAITSGKGFLGQN